MHSRRAPEGGPQDQAACPMGTARLGPVTHDLQRGAEGATASCAMWKVEGEPRPLGEMPAWTKPSDRKRGLEAKHSKGD